MASDNSDNTNTDSSVTAPGCSGSIPIIPLRYAIMPSHDDNKEQYAYEKSKGNLEKDFVKIKTSHYTLRTTRPGYIYMYDEIGKGILRLWEADGDGNYTALQWTSMEDYGKRSNRLETLPYITTKDSPHTVHIAFSNDLWPKSITEKAIADASFRKTRMQPLEVGEILDASGKISAQKHILPVSEIEQFVEEYRIPQKEYKTAFSWSTYKPDSVTKPSNIKALAAEYGEAHRIKLPVIFALKDAQGITEDQGNLASLYLHQLVDLKNTVNDKKKETSKPTTKLQLPDVVKLDTSKISNISAEFHRKKTISDIIESLLKSTYPSEKYDLKTMTRLSKETLKNAYGHANVREVGDSEAKLHALGNTHVNKDASELLDHVDTKELYKFRREWDSIQAGLEVKKKKTLLVVEDHANWLKTGESDQVNKPNSLAICWSCYDRNSKLSAYAFELAAVLAMDGIGTPVSGFLKQDKRNQLLENWINDLNSPLHLAAAPFDPFSQKLDNMGDILDGSGKTISGLSELLPRKFATVRITSIITEYSLRKINGKTRWDKSKSIVKAVKEAIENKNLSRLFDILLLRYNVSENALLNQPITKKYYAFIDKSLLHSKAVEQSLQVKGNRAVTLTDTVTTTEYKTIPTADLLKSIAGAGLNNFVMLLHALNLKMAIASFSRDASLKNNAALLSALFGFMGAFIEASAATAAVLKQTPLAKRVLVGKVIEKMLMKRITNSSATKFLGYAGAAAEAIVHTVEAGKLFSQGDNDAAGYSLATAALLGTGVALMAKGAAASALVPGIGWVVAGVLLIAAGIGTLILSFMKKDTPMQIWVSRTIFGVPRLAYGISKVDIAYKNTSEELEGYFITTYRPILIEETDKEVFGYSAETDWDQNIGKDEAKFIVLLPGYTEGTSKWTRSNVIGYDDNDVDSKEDADKANIVKNNIKVTGFQRIKPEGLYLHIRRLFDDSAASASITIDYWPNQAISEKKVTHTFYIDQ